MGLIFQSISFTNAVMANQDKNMINFVLITTSRQIISMFHGVRLQAAQRFSLLKNKLQITDARFVGNIIVWLVGATTMMVRHVHNIALQTLMEKMIKSLNSL